MLEFWRMEEASSGKVVRLKREVSEDERQPMRVVGAEIAEVEMETVSELGHVLKFLGIHHVLPACLEHLKRVRRDGKQLQVLLGSPSNDIELPGAASGWKRREVQLPAQSPSTRAQFERWRRVWPFAVVPARATAEQALPSVAYGQKLFEELQRRRPADGRAVAVVVDPASSRVLVEATEFDPQSHRLASVRHASVLAVDALAELESTHPQKLPPGQHLLNGLDVVLAREPCVMCSMTLLHARVARVFYVQQASWSGVRGEFALQHCPHVNHRYEVYQLLQEPEASVSEADEESLASEDLKIIHSILSKNQWNDPQQFS